jgi:hypothetical protein
MKERSGTRAPFLRLNHEKLAIPDVAMVGGPFSEFSLVYSAGADRRMAERMIHEPLVAHVLFPARMVYSIVIITGVLAGLRQKLRQFR